MEQKKNIWIVIGILFLISTYYLFDLWEKYQEEEFIDSAYQYILKVKPNEDEGDKGSYTYQCIDLDSNSHWYKQIFSPVISSTELYNSVVVGDTIEKNKGVPFILLKRQHLVLKVPVNYDFDKVVDTVLVR